MAPIFKRPTDDPLLEGGGGGGGGGFGGGGFGSRTSIMPKLNKPAKEGYEYRSPEQTNAKSMTPHPLEDVVGSQRADIGRIRQGLSAPGKTERGRTMQQEAGGRAITRTAGRAAAAGAAGLGGAEMGKRLRNRADAENISSDANMEPSMDSDSVSSAPPAPMPPPRPRRQSAPTPTGSVREGQNENIDDNTRARAMASVNGMKKGGMTKKYAKGGSVSSASSRADGVAQRGKTRGKIC
jgi:hypothetical protein